MAGQSRVEKQWIELSENCCCCVRMFAVRVLARAVANTGTLASPPKSVAKMSTIVLTKDLERAQKSQEVSLRENCILVDVNDRPTGHASKRDCHRVGDNGKLLLHRAFSVFLFNTRGEMLVQRRSSHKVSERVTGGLTVPKV